MYFHSLLDLGGCDASNGGLAQLETDLASVDTTPNYAYIVPNLCNDGTESPCVDGSTGGLPAADAFLAQWVPKIPLLRTVEDLFELKPLGEAEDAPSLLNGVLAGARVAQAGDD